jgi:hypothetical protein
VGSSTIFLNPPIIATIMAQLTFEDLSFEEQKDKIRVNFLRLFYFYLSKKEIK